LQLTGKNFAPVQLQLKFAFIMPACLISGFMIWKNFETAQSIVLSIKHIFLQVAVRKRRLDSPVEQALPVINQPWTHNFKCHTIARVFVSSITSKFEMSQNVCFDTLKRCYSTLYLSLCCGRRVCPEV